MGFELYWQEVPVGEEPLCHAPERGCFELVEDEMATTIRAMSRLDMIDHSARPLVSADAFGVCEQLDFHDADGTPIEYPVDTPEGIYQRAIVAVQRGDTGGRIPVWKLESNGAWLITEQEIRRALDAYESALRTDGGAASQWQRDEPVWWEEWVAFLRAATKRGGVEVY